MALNNINPNKRKKILMFFLEKFNVDLEKYDDDEISVIVQEVKKMLKKRIIEEKNKYNELSSKLEKEKMFMGE